MREAADATQSPNGAVENPLKQPHLSVPGESSWAADAERRDFSVHRTMWLGPSCGLFYSARRRTEK